MNLQIAPLAATDRADWEVLARGYKTFYQTTLADADYEAAWERLQHQDGVFGWGAKADGRLAGMAHVLFHASVWAPQVCYLQDLFVCASMRGHGLARALVEHVARAARERGAQRLYWLTRQENEPARRLYDKLATFNGFIRYDYPL